MFPIFGLAVGIRQAEAETVDLALTCDSTLAPVLRKAAAAYTAATSVRIFVFPTGPGLILPQLQRDIQNDIVISRRLVIDQAVQDDLIAYAAPLRWRNPLVIAGKDHASALDQSLAITDPNPAAVVDGAYVLAQFGLKPRRVLGVVDTDEVAFLIGTGVAQAGLLHMTDVRAHGLKVIRAVPPDIWPWEVYAACVTQLSQRPHPQGFLAFLTMATTTRLLADGGLEVLA